MQTKYKVLIIIAVGATGVAVGRFTVPERVKIETKTVEVVKTITVKDTTKDKKVHKETTIVEVTKPDGTKETTTKVVLDSDLKKDTTTHTNVSDSKSADDKSETTKTGSRLNISVLAGAPVSLHGLGNFVYGVHVSRDLLGPISVGLFGLSDGVVGGSIGLTF